MSFRRRLMVALVMIVLVPITAIVVVLFRLSGESREGKADARLAGAMPAVEAEYDRAATASARAVTALAREPALQRAIGRPGDLAGTLQAQARRRGLAYAALFGAGGEELAASGEEDSVPQAGVRLQGPDGEYRLIVAATGANEFVAAASRLTELGVAVSRPGGSAVFSGDRAPGLDFSGGGEESQDIELSSGEEARARVVSLSDAGGRVRLALIGPQGEQVLSSGQVLIGVLLATLLLLSMTLIVPLLRDLQRLHDRVADEAVTDELTGLSNQRRFRQTITKEAERARRFDRPLSLLLMDLDDFKLVNDTYGHLEGDQVLRQVAHMLVGESREVDEPARYGGEEFAVALPETDIEGAVGLAERIRQRIESTPILLTGKGGEIRVTISIGVSGSPDHARDPQRMIQAADEALYEAKRAGKNQVCRADTEEARRQLDAS